MDIEGQLMPTRGNRRSGNNSSALILSSSTSRLSSVLTLLDLGRVRATVEPVSSPSKSMVSKEKAELTVPELKLKIKGNVNLFLLTFLISRDIA